MCQALREIMADEINEAVEEGIKAGLQEAVQEAVSTTESEDRKKHACSIVLLCKEWQLKQDEIVSRIKTLLEVDEAQALEYYNMFA